MCTEMPWTLFTFVFSITFLCDGVNSKPSCFAPKIHSCSNVTSSVVSKSNCPSGFDQVGKYCFKVSDEYVSWNEGKQKCEERNAKLAEPKEISDFYSYPSSEFFSNEFKNYLQRFRKSTYDKKHGTFSLGGACTYGPGKWHQSCKWLSGGKINSYLYEYFFNDDREKCIKISYRPHPHLWAYFPDCVIFTESCERESRYVCQGPAAKSTYRSCLHEGKEYYNGQFVSINAPQCEQTWCEDGSIETYTCGNGNARCCEHGGDIYGDGDIIVPAACTPDNGCEHEGDLYGDGDIIVPAACTPDNGMPDGLLKWQDFCQDGLVKWQDCSDALQNFCI